MQKLSSSKFTWENSDVCVGCSKVDVFGKTGNVNHLNPTVEIIGYCDAADLAVRPRKDEKALMVRDHSMDEEYWIHISQDDFEKLLQKEKETEEWKKQSKQNLDQY